jgi:hypothetical protein
MKRGMLWVTAQFEFFDGQEGFGVIRSFVPVWGAAGVRHGSVAIMFFEKKKESPRPAPG